MKRTVILRCGWRTQVWRSPILCFYWLHAGLYPAADAAPTAPLAGGLELWPVADLWRADGRWRENGTDHPLDIVAGLEGGV